MKYVLWGWTVIWENAKQMPQLLRGFETKSKSFLWGRGYETKIEHFHCRLKLDLAVLNFEIFKTSDPFKQACLPALPATSSN